MQVDAFSCDGGFTVYAKRIPHNGTIGVFCPSHVADMGRYAPGIAAIERLGFTVKLSANIEKNTYGYAASAEERADDLNELVADDSVHIVLFGGGESAVEILPLIDYENILRHPKIFSSYSDGTSILNAIHAQTVFRRICCVFLSVTVIDIISRLFTPTISDMVQGMRFCQLADMLHLMRINSNCYFWVMQINTE